MNDRPDPRQDAAAGRCASCQHARVTVSDRGTRFIRCELAKTDPRFRKYPAIPVMWCEGYQPDTMKA